MNAIVVFVLFVSSMSLISAACGLFLVIYIIRKGEKRIASEYPDNFTDSPEEKALFENEMDKLLDDCKIKRVKPNGRSIDLDKLRNEGDE